MQSWVLYCLASSLIKVNAEENSANFFLWVWICNSIWNLSSHSPSENQPSLFQTLHLQFFPHQLHFTLDKPGVFPVLLQSSNGKWRNSSCHTHHWMVSSALRCLQTLPATPPQGCKTSRGSMWQPHCPIWQPHAHLLGTIHISLDLSQVNRHFCSSSWIGLPSSMPSPLPFCLSLRKLCPLGLLLDRSGFILWRIVLSFPEHLLPVSCAACCVRGGANWKSSVQV